MCLTHQSQLAQSLLSCSTAFQFSSKVEVLIFLFTFLQIYSVVRRDSKIDNFTNFLFFFFWLIIMRSSLLAGIWWSVCMLKSHRSLCVAFSRTGAGLCIYHLFVLLLLLLLLLAVTMEFQLFKSFFFLFWLKNLHINLQRKFYRIKEKNSPFKLYRFMP